MKQVIESPNAPAPIGPYSRAIRAGNLVYLSGAIALRENGEMVQDTIESETKQVMENIRTILGDAGCGWEDVVKTSIYLSDMKHFAAVNNVYASYFTGEYPARETVAVAGLPKSANVEISVIAAIPAGIIE
jgi:2-iminobutanoate/2-iminopropanoate deaminase